MVAGLCRKKARVYMYLGASAFIKAPRYTYTMAANENMKIIKPLHVLKKRQKQGRGEQNWLRVLKNGRF